MKPLLFSALFAGASALSANAVVLNYSNDFSSSVAEFTPSSGTQWTLPGGGIYQNVVPGNTASATVLEVTGLGSGTKQGFEISTVFTLSETAASASVGFVALGTTNSTGTASFYLADISQAGGMRFRPFVAGAASPSDLAVTTTGTAVGTLGTSEVITLTLRGTYDISGALTLALIAFDGTNTQTITTATPIAGPTDGTFFGYRNRSNTAGDGITVQFESLSITAIPEPTSLTLLALGGLGFAMRRRRL